MILPNELIFFEIFGNLTYDKIKRLIILNRLFLNEIKKITKICCMPLEKNYKKYQNVSYTKNINYPLWIKEFIFYDPRRQCTNVGKWIKNIHEFKEIKITSKLICFDLSNVNLKNSSRINLNIPINSKIHMNNTAMNPQILHLNNFSRFKAKYLNNIRTLILENTIPTLLFTEKYCVNRHKPKLVLININLGNIQEYKHIFRMFRNLSEIHFINCENIGVKPKKKYYNFTYPFDKFKYQGIKININ